MDPAKQNVFKKMELFTVCPTERLQAWPVHMFLVLAAPSSHILSSAHDSMVLCLHASVHDSRSHVPGLNSCPCWMLYAVQMVLKATDHRGKVPWQETLTPPHNPKWKVSPHPWTVLLQLSLAAHLD